MPAPRWEWHGAEDWKVALDRSWPDVVTGIFSATFEELRPLAIRICFRISRTNVIGTPSACVPIDFEPVKSGIS